MFQDSNYDVLEFNAPSNGMNRKISRDILPSNFAYVFENVLPVPAGEIQVRYGTKKIIDMPFINRDYETLAAFPYQKQNGEIQIVSYLSYLREYIGATNIEFIDTSTFKFTPNNQQNNFYESDTDIKIIHSGARGIITSYDVIKNIKFNNDGTIEITLKSDSLQDNANITSLFFSKGKIVVYDFLSNALVPGAEVDNLHAGVVPRYVHFLSSIIICNGVDKMLTWDGNTMQQVYDFVKEQTLAFNRIDDNNFTFTANAAFDITKYQNDAVINLVVNGITTTLNVETVAVNGSTVTLTTEQDIPDFDGQSRIELFYRDYPPPFSYLHVSYDRIWALPPGAVSLSYREPSETLKVYYCYRTNSLTNWFNETTKTVPSIDISAKHGVPDNLEAILNINGYTAFVGRKKTQIWSGQDPINLQSSSPFTFSSIIPIGVFHGNLINEFPNDTYIVSENGVVSFGTLNIAKQFAATSVDAVDPLVRNFVQTITSEKDNKAYRSCRSFKYVSGSFCGFKIGFNSTLIGMFSVNIYSWSLFSGDFKFANTFLTDLDNSLYLFIDDVIYLYADGVNGPPFYSDRDGIDHISFMLSFPTTQLNGRKYANTYFEIDLQYPSSWWVNEENNIYLSIDGDVRETFSSEVKYTFTPRGDIIETIPLLEKSIPDPNTPDEREIGMRLDIPYERNIQRLKFSSSKFVVTISGQISDGPVVMRKVKLFGKIERS